MEKKKIILPIMCFCAISMVPSCDKSKTCSVTEGEYNEIVNSIVDNKSFVGNLTNNSFATYSMPERIEGYYAVNKDAEAHFTPNYDETFKYDYTWAKINNIWKKLKLIDCVSGDVYEEEATAQQRELHIILDCLDYSKGKFKDATFGVDKDDPDEDDLSYSFTNPSYTIANIEYSVKSLLKFAPRMHYEGDK